jgi:hypothetical protein
MAKIYRIYNTDISHNTKVLEKASATVIPEGSLVALDAGGLAIIATATSTAVAYCETGGADGETEIIVVNDDRLILSGTANANFAKANRGTEVDITTTTQLIDLGASLTDVLKVLPSIDAGTVGETTDVRVRINKSL